MPPPKQKPIAPSLPSTRGRAFSHCAGRDEVLEHLRTVHLPELHGAFLVVAGKSADRGEAVGRERDEVRDGEAARDVLDVGIQAAVLVDRRSPPAPCPLAFAGRAK